MIEQTLLVLNLKQQHFNWYILCFRSGQDRATNLKMLEHDLLNSFERFLNCLKSIFFVENAFNTKVCNPIRYNTDTSSLKTQTSALNGTAWNDSLPDDSSPIKWPQPPEFEPLPSWLTSLQFDPVPAINTTAPVKDWTLRESLQKNCSTTVDEQTFVRCESSRTQCIIANVVFTCCFGVFSLHCFLDLSLNVMWIGTSQG